MSILLGLVGLLRVATPAAPARILEARALPTERTSLVKPEDVDRHRALACASYEGCLDAAYRYGWKSWSCQRCPLFAGRGRRVGTALAGARGLPQRASSGARARARPV